MIVEVFRREREGQPYQHAGSVEAPDLRFAEAYAREQFGRRNESTALLLVPREAKDEGSAGAATQPRSSTTG